MTPKKAAELAEKVPSYPDQYQFSLREWPAKMAPNLHGYREAI